MEYPTSAQVFPVTSTEEMLEVCLADFPRCDGLVGVAAPCDYKPVLISERKIAKTGDPLVLHLVETPDVVATLGASKRSNQWVVGFALETEDIRFRALAKMERKSCDLMVLNGPQAMNADENSVEVMKPSGEILAELAGRKESVADGIFTIIEQELIQPT